MFNYIKKHNLGFLGFCLLTFIFTLLLILIISTDVNATMSNEDRNYYYNNPLPEENYLEIYSNGIDYLDTLDLSNYGLSDYTIYHYLLFRPMPERVHIVYIIADTDFYDFYTNNPDSIRLYYYISLTYNVFDEYYNLDYVSRTRENAYPYTYDLRYCLDDYINNNSSYRGCYFDFDFMNYDASFVIPANPFHSLSLPVIDDIDNVDTFNMARFVQCMNYLDYLGYDCYYDYLIYEGHHAIYNQYAYYFVFFIEPDYDCYVAYMNSVIQYNVIWCNHCVIFLYTSDNNTATWNDVAVRDTDSVDYLPNSYKSSIGSVYMYSTFTLKNGNDNYFVVNHLITDCFYSFYSVFPDGEIMFHPRRNLFFLF